MMVLFQSGINKRAQLGGAEEGLGMGGIGLISRNRKDGRRRSNRQVQSTGLLESKEREEERAQRLSSSGIYRA